MSYRVEWTPEAENDLAAIWSAVPDQRAITDAAAWLDQQLTRRPLALGEPWVSSIHRIATFGPLGIEYEVIEDDSLVLVHGAFAVG